ncbi:uncharacterized protein I206_107497 [Kwoniella pini CBS 10737]|uniref:non-specific serine/threonine protein kinase n=1 Tax=Kwoniella pini CBS 10737 TaxID=1296096 RepID=A0A1B9HXF5_9TREE|nr:AGC protein kinase [Kwoniella pini CBS 10737]OCF47959.1 AGC protein kinase [Kwoniella pini CBS 10737]
MLGSPSQVPLPPSPAYSGHDSPPTIMSRLAPPNGISTPDRTPSSSSSFGEDGSPTSYEAGPSVVHEERRHASASDVSRNYIAKLEDFQLIKVIGKGCAGRVLLIKHTPTNNVRAMKAISKRSVLTHDELNHTLTEQSILKRFAIDEPNNRFISKLYNSFTDRENFYFVMEFYPGGDLATQMEIHGILGDHRTRFYAADITQGLEDLHRHGIIVRDLKPENILLNAKGHAVLADFGLSKEFSYRGDPKPIHVVTYPGQPELPPWAGQGAGSLRTMASGQKNLMIDKAYSFVGTSEYLSPEVVKRGDYSYAVDWWALGCIVLEGLVGRVPFRKLDDEPPMVLWNKILFQPWDELFHEPKMARFMPDPVTYHFIDALLQKDPMWRLTEPCVKQHDYFALLDWDTVRKGEYQDPHSLDLHPIAEYNIKYFPKLCLEEDLSVDMSTHDLRNDEIEHKKTPLNDNALYALEQAKYRYELENFAWSRDNDGYETVAESEMEESVTDQEEIEGGRIDGADEMDPIQSNDIEDVLPDTLKDEEVEVEDMEEEPVLAEHVDVERKPVPDVITAITSANMQEPIVTPAKDQRRLSHFGSPESAYSDNLPSSFVGLPASPASVAPAIISSVEDIAVKLIRSSESNHENTIVSSPPEGSIAPSPPAHDHDVPNWEGSGRPMSRPVERLSQTPQQDLPESLISLTSSTHPTKSHPIPIPLRPKPVRQISEELNLNLPTGLPSSGLSVSDIVSIPSPHPGSPNRILRRHRQMGSVDTVPMARLSVELHGVRTYIDDEDWEELTLDDPNASAPNGGGSNHSFLGLGRVLKRRPSNLLTNSMGTNNSGSGSGLKRQIKNSDTSSSRNSQATSPIKSLTNRPVLFSNKSIENTKKAFEKFKAFPKLKNLASPENKIPLHSPLIGPPFSADNKDLNSLPHPTGILGNSIPSNAQGNNSRPVIAYRRHTESGLGWLRRSPKKSSSNKNFKNPSALSLKDERNQSEVSSPIANMQGKKQDGSIDNSTSSVSISKNNEGLPKLELSEIELTGLDWEPFNSKEWGVK